LRTPEFQDKVASRHHNRTFTRQDIERLLDCLDQSLGISDRCNRSRTTVSSIDELALPTHNGQSPIKEADVQRWRPLGR